MTNHPGTRRQPQRRPRPCPTRPSLLAHGLNDERFTSPATRRRDVCVPLPRAFPSLHNPRTPAPIPAQPRRRRGTRKSHLYDQLGQSGEEKRLHFPAGSGAAVGYGQSRNKRGNLNTTFNDRRSNYRSSATSPSALLGTAGGH